MDTDEHGDESSAAQGGRAHAASPGLGPMLGEQVQQEFRDAHEVDNLCNAEERSNDQGSAVGPFEEGRGPFPLPDLPGEKWHRQLSVHPTPPGQPLAVPCLTASLQRLNPGKLCCLAQPPQQITHYRPSALQVAMQKLAPSLHLARSRRGCLRLQVQLRQPHACIKRSPCSKAPPKAWNRARWQQILATTEIQKQKKSLHALKQPDHSLAEDQRIRQLRTAHSASAPADIVQSSPRRDRRLNTVEFSNSWGLGRDYHSIASLGRNKISVL